MLKPAGWFDATEATQADILLRAGTYSAPIVINKKVTLKKWDGNGNVVIGQ